MGISQSCNGSGEASQKFNIGILNEPIKVLNNEANLRLVAMASSASVWLRGSFDLHSSWNGSINLHCPCQTTGQCERGVGGVTVSMVAFQAVDPGSTPGRRMFVFETFGSEAPTFAF